MPGRDKRETCVAKDDISDFVTSNLILFKKRSTITLSRIVILLIPILI